MRLPWNAQGELNLEVWAQWEAHEPIVAVEAAAEALVSADTDFYVDCGMQNERGYADQAEDFVAQASSLLGAEQLSLDFYQGDHDSLVYPSDFMTR